MKLNLLYALVLLSRPVNVVIAFLTIIVAAKLAGGLDPFGNVLLAAISASLIMIGANVINDYYDIEIDKINKPTRPLAAGTISGQQALVYCFVVFVIALFCAAFINVQMFLIALIFSLLLILYSYRLKRTILWGNLLVSFTTAMAFVYGGGAVNHYQETLFPAGFALFFHFGREILKDIQDVEGDKRVGAITFPIKYGIQKSLILVMIDFILLVILTVIPYIFDIYSWKYFVVICVGIYPVLLYVLLQSFKNPDPERIGFLSNLLKADMIIGLLAIYLG